ncbi:hypothetical protein RhiirA4_476966 [Rhizophagus irregularis]|uniref:Uncharacterized protein n=1 Tax=Rhizophagus irregularis TaxID=588596 RepID=A0A2I1HCF0_9GLOM|nr:hypothetical protein RhiirA4_476966 [Rhizophagus irregularis]
MTAFMDDTTLITNIGKYELIKINNNQDNLVIEGEEVKKVNSCEGNRYLGLSSFNNLEFYTDSSLIRYNDSFKMGFGWIFSDVNLDIKFSGMTIDWVSSTKAEALPFYRVL